MRNEKAIDALFLALMAALVVALIAWAHALSVQIAGADAQRAGEAFAVHPNDRTNTAAIERMRHAAEKKWTAQRVEQLAILREATESRESQQDGTHSAVWAGYDPEPANDANGAVEGAGNGAPWDVVHDGGWRYTWYSDREQTGPLAYAEGYGGVLGDDGVYRDGEGYVMVAANRSDLGAMDTVDTPYGEGKVYDTGCPAGTIDVYTSW